MKQKSVIRSAVAFAVFAAAAAACAQNLVRDDFTPDNWGGYVGWDATQRTRIRCVLEPLDELSPNGKKAIRITSEQVFDNAGMDGMEVKTSRPLKLKVGEHYRMSAYFRTKGLAPCKRRTFLLHGQPWYRGSSSLDLPADTDGKWVKLEWEGKLAVTKCDGNAVFSIYTSEALGKGAYIDFAEPYLEGPVASDDPKDDFWQMKPAPMRITPFDPLLDDIRAKDARMTFYYPGELKAGSERLTLRATARGKTVTAPFGADHKATAAFGELEPGPLTLRCELVGAESGRVLAVNEYRARAREDVIDPTPLRRLNNFVREVFTRPLADGTYDFTLAKGMWIYIGFSKAVPGATAELDGEKDVVRYRANARSEGMRYLAPGRHAVRVAGVPADAGATFSVRVVNTIYRSALHLTEGPSPNFNGYRYGEEFWRRLGLLEGFNMTSVRTRSLENPRMMQLIDEMKGRGCEVGVGFGFGAWDRRRLDGEAYYAFVASNAAYRAGHHMSFDENSIAPHFGKLTKMNSTEVWWKAYEDGRRVDVFFDDGACDLYVNPTYDIPEVAAYVNSGDGRGLMFAEAYFRAVESREQLDGFIGFLRRQNQTIRATVPSAAGRFSFLLCGWMMSGAWSPWYYTEMDMRAMLGEICKVLATDPEFDGNGGLTFSTPACWEDFWRFVSVGLVRYYCIEGGTGDYAAMNGMKLFPGHLRNGDFMRDFEGWTVEAAEPGSVTVGEKPNFGTHWQGRQYPAGYKRSHKICPGDRFAMLTRSAKAPNRLRQKLVGLEPGRVYQVVYTAADWETVERNFEAGQTANADRKGRKAANPIVLEAEVTGAETIRELCHTYTNFLKYGKDLNRTSRIVFRATSPEAEIAFSDWRTPSDPGAGAGTKTIFNFIMAHPYYYEDEAQLDVLKDLFDKAHGGKGK